MKGIRINIKGKWAHFKRADTNNNPLSHDVITKTAIIGMIGAITGKDRISMKQLYPILSQDLKYGVKINNDVKKQSCGFTFRSTTNCWDKVPKQIEFLRDVNYDVIICLTNERSKDIFETFASLCEQGKSYYEPVLGLHNCPAEIRYITKGDIDYAGVREFETQGFVTDKHIPIDTTNISLRLGFDKIPTFQNDDFWNLPDKYVPIVYPSKDNFIKVKGECYIFGNDQWSLI